jgi:paired amphipathic helix protein Sin3a
MGTTVQSLAAHRPPSPRAPTNGAGQQGGDRQFYDSSGRNLGAAWPQTNGPAAEMFSPGRSAPAQPAYSTQQSQNAQAPLSPEQTATREHQAATSAALVHQQEQRGVSQLQNAVSMAANRPNVLSPAVGAAVPLTYNGNVPQMQGVNATIEKRGPVEFNHAISYVNKIKVSSIFLSQAQCFGWSF